MKKLIALLLSLVMVFSLTSCFSSIVKKEPQVEKEENTAETIVEEIPEKPEVNAAVFWYNCADAFISKVHTALDAELDRLGIQYTNYDAAGTQETQNDQIDTAISQGANLLLVNIVDTAAIDVAQNVVDKAKEANIPVIFFNREISDDVINSYENACFVGTRAEESGQCQGIMIGEYLIRNYDAVDLNGDGKISYVMLKGELGCPECEARTKYAVEYCNDKLTAAGKPELIYHDPDNTDMFLPGNWSRTTAYELLEVVLSAHPMNSDTAIEIVIANNDDMAIGAIEALNNVGWNTGEKPFIPVFGIDYTTDAQTAIETGKMTGSVLMSADNIAEAVALLVDNVSNDKHVFTDAEENYKVDEYSAKIRVPFEIKE